MSCDEIIDSVNIINPTSFCFTNSRFYRETLSERDFIFYKLKYFCAYLCRFASVTRKGIPTFRFVKKGRILSTETRDVGIVSEHSSGGKLYLYILDTPPRSPPEERISFSNRVMTHRHNASPPAVFPR